MLSKDALIMPCKGVLKLCAMSLPVSLSCRHPFVYISTILLLCSSDAKEHSFFLIAEVLQDLWRSRCSLKDVEGFDHSGVNETLGACGYLPGEQQGPCLPYYVWQCGYTKVKSNTVSRLNVLISSHLKVTNVTSKLEQKLSKVYSLMDLNFSEPIHSCSGKTKVHFVIFLVELEIIRVFVTVVGTSIDCMFYLVHVVTDSN